MTGRGWFEELPPGSAPATRWRRDLPAGAVVYYDDEEAARAALAARGGLCQPWWDVHDLVRAAVRAGHLSVRGLAQRYRHRGATRALVRAVLIEEIPGYATDDERWRGPGRQTNTDHEANRARRRRDPAYPPALTFIRH